MLQVVRSRSAQIAALVITSIAILFLRRPDQFLTPAMWAEEGVYILAQYADRGLTTIFEPINGYINLSARLLALAAYKTSLAWAPEVAMTLTIAFTCAVVLAIAMAPTVLRWPFLCALAVLLVPSDPEVFGVALYSFWWAGLLLLLALLWDASRGATWLRFAFIALGGLSSPLIVPFAALMLLRAAVERDRQEVAAAAIASLFAVVQLNTLIATGTAAAAQLIGWREAYVAVNKLAGLFLAEPAKWIKGPGFVVLALVCASAWRVRRQLDWRFYLLTLAYLAVCSATVLRAPVPDLHIIVGGPRYYFYPLTLLMWLMLWIAALSPNAVRAVLAIGYVLAVLSIGSNMSRRHEALEWRRHIAACAGSERYEVPVLVESKASDVWKVPLTGAQCRQMIRDSLTGT
jgi:hypothetical protein